MGQYGPKMNLVQLSACGLEGIEGYPVSVEISRSDAAGGTGRTTVVGLPDSAVRESIDRVTPALYSNGVDAKMNDHIGRQSGPS